MAVLDSLPGIEATICVDGVALREYEDDEVERKTGEVGEYQAAKTVSRYVESITDREFSIDLSIKPPYIPTCPTLGFRICIDGVRVRHPRFEPFRHGLKTPWKKSFEGIKSKESGRGIMKPFKFSKIETTTDDATLSTLTADAKRISKVGEITVHIYRENTIQRSDAIRPSIELGAGAAGEVHEKALKGQAKSHGAILGEARPARVRDGRCKADKLDGDNYPIAIFKFKYRSNDALKQLLVIRPTPEPDGVPISDKKIKRERENNVHVEGSRKKSKKSEDIETIDLTHDS